MSGTALEPFALVGECEKKAPARGRPVYFVHGAQGLEVARRYVQFRVIAENASAAREFAIGAALLDRQSVIVEPWKSAHEAIWYPVEIYAPADESRRGLILTLNCRRA